MSAANRHPACSRTEDSSSRRRGSHRAFPGFVDEMLAEAVVRFAARDELELRLLIEAARRRQLAVRPQRDALISRLPREADALGDETRADAQSARGRLDEQQA